MSTFVSVVPSTILFALTLAMGMGLRVADFARLRRYPRALLLGAVGQILLLPAIALAIAMAFGLGHHAAVGLVLIAACPGGATSNALTRLARGDEALSISLTALSSTVSFLTVPAVLGIAFRVFGGAAGGVSISAGEALSRLFLLTAAPLAMGMLAHRMAPGFTARVRGPLLATALSLLLLLLVGLGVSTSRAGIDLGRLLGELPSVALLIAAMATLGIVGSRALGLPAAQTRAITIELAIQNFNLALVVSLTLLGEPRYAGPALVYLPLMLVVAGLAIAWGRRSRPEAGPERTRQRAPGADFGNWIRLRIVAGFGLVGILLVGGAAIADRPWLVASCAIAGGSALALATYLSYLRYLFSEGGGGLQHRLWQLVLEALPWDGHGTALDVGTGNGALAVLLAHGRSAAEVVGVDPWPPAWEYSQHECERNATACGVGQRVTFQQASAASLPFADARFDAVVSHFVFHEVGDGPAARQALLEALRVLRPGGAFAFQDMFLDRSVYGDIQAWVEELRAHLREVHFQPLGTRMTLPIGTRSRRVLGAAGLLYGAK